MAAKVMQQSLLALVLMSGLTCLAAEAIPKWFNLRTTFGINPLAAHTFEHQPRTFSEADSHGWIKIPSRCDTKQFAGVRMIRSKKDLDIVLLFDANGFIAGFQSVVPVADTLDDKYYSFSTQPMYQKDEIFGVPVYLTTAYFVDPAMVCEGGRTQVEFEREGTGHILLMQNGPNYEAKNLLTIPLTEKQAVSHPMWFKHKCFVNMGNHFFPMGYDPDFDCKTQLPIQVLYEDDHLKGFVWQHVAKLRSPRFESVNEKAIDMIVDRPPKCLKPLTKKPGVSTMHVYLMDYADICLF